MTITGDLDRLYALLDRPRRRCGGERRLADCTGRDGWPDRGVYFFFEAGEFRADGDTPRVVRIGTHALRPSKSTLWKRLAQHRGTTSGGGNHRGSIFRLHVGTALLARDEWRAEIRETWGVGSTASREVRESEQPLEQAVSAHIGGMPFLWVGVDDPPGSDSDRGHIERSTIALLAAARRVGLDSPSPTWLGHQADRAAIRVSGLWNVNHVEDVYDPAGLDALERWVGS